MGSEQGSVHDVAIQPANELDRLAAEFGTDKSTVKVGVLSPKGYTVHYHRHLAHLRQDPIRLLEIGIAQGASLKMWEAYFPRATIYGIDIEPSCRRFETERTKVFVGDQSHRSFLRHVIAEAGGTLDVVIDDGGHRMSQHRAALDELFPRLTSGGLYAIEDLHTAYWAQYGGGYLEDDSTLEYLKRQIDALNGAKEIVQQAETRRSRLTALFTRHRGTAEGLPPARQRLEGIYFYRSLVFLLAR